MIEKYRSLDQISASTVFYKLRDIHIHVSERNLVPFLLMFGVVRFSYQNHASRLLLPHLREIFWIMLDDQCAICLSFIGPATGAEPVCE